MIKSIKTHQNSVIVTDIEGNEIWYLKIGRGISLSIATFENNDYEFNTQWKKCKKGRISFKFTEWVEKLDKEFSTWYHKNLNKPLSKYDINKRA